MSTAELSRCEFARSICRLPRAAKKRILPPSPLVAARRLRAEWETYLAETGFALAEDAMSKDLVSLEDAGLEERDTRAVFGLFAEGVSSGVRAVCDSFYEEDSADHMAG